MNRRQVLKWAVAGIVVAASVPYVVYGNDPYLELVDAKGKVVARVYARDPSVYADLSDALHGTESTHLEFIFEYENTNGNPVNLRKAVWRNLPHDLAKALKPEHELDTRGLVLYLYDRLHLTIPVDVRSTIV